MFLHSKEELILSEAVERWTRKYILLIPTLQGTCMIDLAAAAFSYTDC